VRLEARLLGPLEVSVDGVPVRLTGRPSVLFAVLAMSAGAVVSAERLATAVWGDELPGNPRASVQTNMTRLRQLIGAQFVETTAVGYLLRVRPEQIDALRFLELIAVAASVSDLDTESRTLTDALALWRGHPFEGMRSVWLAEAETPRLIERYLGAVERRIDLELAAGRHEGLVGELRDLISRHPLRESLWVRLLDALDAAGRRAEALEQYETIRRRLVEELGTDPGPRLREMHAKLLGGLPSPAQAGAPASQVVVPRQLPMDLAGFVGRDEALATMDGRLGDETSPTVITVVAGAAGVGKTALAIRWAHRVAPCFPDGQLHANLRGFDPSGTPRTPQEVLRGFLVALQPNGHQVPHGLDAQVGLYRSLLSGRRMLIVLDNARDAEQVRPLLPSSRGSHVVVTSRDDLTGLIVAEGARSLPLDVLSPQEGWQLLEQRLGAQRVHHDPSATDEVIERCARLPLALSVMAARAARRPDASMRALALELANTRSELDAFAVNDPMTDVRAVFSWSYRTLSVAAARLFRLLSIHMGPEVSVVAAAAAGGLQIPHARRLLMELHAARMITESAPDRFAFHDLLRAYSAELAQQLDTEEQRHEALLRLLDYYMHAAIAAAVALDQYRVPIPVGQPCDGVIVEPIADYREATKWFARERPALVASVHSAVRAGADEVAWRISWAISGFLDVTGYWDERAATIQATLHISPRNPEWPWQALGHRSLGHTYVRMGQYADAHRHLSEALDLFRRSGDQVGQARTHLNIGIVLDRQGDPARGITHSLEALNLYRAAGHLAGQADSLNAVGWDNAQLGNFEQALTYCRQSLEIHLQLDHRHGQADVWDSLGYIQRGLGRYEEAYASYRQAIGIFRDLGDRFDEAGTLVNLADSHMAAGDPATARGVYLDALEILDELRHPDAANVRGKLGALTEVHALDR
jgi:DNA-binding SARP family transcriptional activator/tetratricopeptide (TPR) repeat protein